MIELLAPAGNIEKLKSAILYGADAVYLAGKDYGLRAFSGNFSKKEINEAVIYSHSKDVKVYVTINIFGHPDDFLGLEEYISFLYKCGVDAVIVSDPGIFSVVRKIAPNLEIHISTQASVTNALAAQFWHKAGAKRIVLARELTLDEIINIRKEISEEIELEAFVHGAMCMAYSGRCLLSNYFTGRDANKGECAQPCRWKYTLQEEKRPQMPIEAFQDEKGTYFMNSKDLCMVEHIPELIKSGISSFKIEGRMRGVFYVSTVTKAYREAIDSYYLDPEGYIFDPEIMESLTKTVHREFDTGFYFTRPGMDAKISYDETYIKEAKVAGIILEYDSTNKRAIIEQRNKIFEGDKLEVVSPRGKHFEIRAKDLKDCKGNSINSTPHPKMKYSISMRIPAVNGSFIRILEDESK